MRDNRDLRRYKDIISESTLREFPDPMPAMADPVANVVDDAMDGDDEAQGPVTKIEVTMKDGDDVEVEVYAEQGDELKRLMDLAGVFHKEKQSGTLSAPDMADPLGTPGIPGGPMDTPPMDPMGGVDAPGMDDSGLPGDDVAIMSPDIGDEVPDGAVPAMDPDMDDMPPVGGPDVPADPMAGPEDNLPALPDRGDDMGDEMGDEIDFSVSGPEEESRMYEEEDEDLEESGKRFDYGHTNPLQGHEPCDLEAYKFSGHANKPVRQIPARSGDNPMIDRSKATRLQAYMEEIETEKKSVSEVEDVEVDAISSKISGSSTMTPQQQKELEKKKEEIKKDPNLKHKDAESVAVELQPGNLTTTQKMALDKTEKDLENGLEEDDLEEKRRRYSFAMRALPTYGLTPSDRMKKSAMKAARRGLRGDR